MALLPPGTAIYAPPVAVAMSPPRVGPSATAPSQRVVLQAPAGQAPAKLRLPATGPGSRHGADSVIATSLHSAGAPAVVASAGTEMKLSHRPVSSGVSSGSTSASSEVAAAAPWSLERTCLLCIGWGQEAYLGGVAKLLDRDAVTSVASAVEQLNAGTITCAEELCAVYSASNQAYYLLFRPGCREKALALSAKSAAGGIRSPPSKQSESTTPRSKELLTESEAKAWKAEFQATHTTQDWELNGDAVDFCLPDIISEGAPGSARLAEEEEQAEEEAEEEIVIGGRLLRLGGVVGRGAFGVVWKAAMSDSVGERHPIAVKVMAPSNAETLRACIFEAELLRLLTAELPATSRDQVPRYVAHSTSQSDEGGTVHLAMTFIPGLVLDHWLYGISDEEHKRVDISEIVNGKLPGGRQRSVLLEHSCDFVSNLLTQLGGVFEALQPLAFHRDVSAHNVLVDVGANGGSLGGEGPREEQHRFALIDFGLAVRSGSWPREWSNCNLAGDPRYWTPAAWMAFVYGFQQVEQHENSGYLAQYLDRIDHYSLGLLGLEVLFALWDVDRRWEEERAPGMLEARAAWCDFWEASFQLFQMFHRGPQECRQTLTTLPDTEGVPRFLELLQKLKVALRSAAKDPGNSRRAVLLSVLADLVDEHGAMQWAEIPELLSKKALSEGCVAQPESQQPESQQRQPLAFAQQQPQPVMSMRAPLQQQQATPVPTQRPRGASQGPTTLRLVGPGSYSAARMRSPSLVRSPMRRAPSPPVLPQAIPATMAGFRGSPCYQAQAPQGRSSACPTNVLTQSLPRGHVQLAVPVATSPAKSYAPPARGEQNEAPHSYIPPPASKGPPSYSPPPVQAASYTPVPTSPGAMAQPLLATMATSPVRRAPSATRRVMRTPARVSRSRSPSFLRSE